MSEIENQTKLIEKADQIRVDNLVKKLKEIIKQSDLPNIVIIKILAKLIFEKS